MTLKLIISDILCGIVIVVSYVLAIIRVYILPQRSIDHSGLHCYQAEALSDVAIDVRLRLHHWLSLLQHSPTA
jgi:hypothetical protein